MPEPLTSQLVAEVLAELHLAFQPRSNAGSDPARMVDVYRNGLNGLSGDSVREAARRCVQTEKFFPKVATLREHASAYDRSRSITIRPLVGSADGDVCRVCGARAELVDIVRKGVVIGQRSNMVHDAQRHGIRQAMEGAA